MKKRLVIKNTENNKYFTGNYNGWWSLDIDNAKKYVIIESLERELAEQYNNDLAFEEVTCVIVETIYIK